MNKTETYKQFLMVAGGVFLSIATIIIIIAGTAFARSASNAQGNNTITVTGTAEVNTKPDIAVISYTLRGEGATAAVAENQIKADIEALTKQLKDAGIKDADIKTESHSVNPKYVYTQGICTKYGCPSGESKITGYEVYHTESIKVRDLDKASEYYGIVTAKKVYSVQGPDLRIEDPIKQKTEAREQAIAKARESAKKLAKSLDVRLGKIVSFYENENGGYPVPMYAKAEVMNQAYDAAGATRVAAPINPGSETTTSNVTIVFRIK
ncbi:MAG TPA: SIMPL domain-containing protein [Candidatus Paceibacterota bacterium]